MRWGVSSPPSPSSRALTATSPRRSTTPEGAPRSCSEGSPSILFSPRAWLEVRDELPDSKKVLGWECWGRGLGAVRGRRLVPKRARAGCAAAEAVHPDLRAELEPSRPVAVDRRPK